MIGRSNGFENKTIRLLPSADQHVPPFLLESMLVDPADLLRGQFITSFTHGRVAARFMVIPELYLFEQLPRRLGHNRALDNAVKLICASNVSQQGAGAVSAGSQAPTTEYVHALRSLQRALDDEHECVTSETLAAATLLQMYEHYVDSSSVGWTVHADGVIKMLELRGPDRIVNDVEKVILKAQTGNIFRTAIHRGTGCFLADPRWKPILGSVMGFNTMNESRQPHSSSIMELGLPLPDIVSRFRATHCLKMTGANLSESRSDLVDDIHSSKRNLLSWWDQAQVAGDESPAGYHDASSTVRMRCASLLAVPTFLATLNYMLVDLRGHKVSESLRMGGDGGVYLSEDIASATSQCQDAVNTAKLQWQALKDLDKAAALNTADLLKMVLVKVLEGTHCELGETINLRHVLWDLVDVLETDLV